jgi:hypothetical protein
MPLPVGSSEDLSVPVAATPAETLRLAAGLMRERAEAASPGPWHQMCMGSEGCSVINDGRLRERKHVSFSGRKEWKADHADAEHIAGMHPFVALAVADWLEAEAGREFADEPDPALKVARAYLGETEVP